MRQGDLSFLCAVGSRPNSHCKFALGLPQLCIIAVDSDQLTCESLVLHEAGYRQLFTLSVDYVFAKRATSPCATSWRPALVSDHVIDLALTERHQVLLNGRAEDFTNWADYDAV